MLIEGNALKIRTIRSILVKSGDIGQNFRTLSFSERCFDTQTKIELVELSEDNMKQCFDLKVASEQM